MLYTYLQIWLLYFQFHATFAVFFHERSHITLKPASNDQETFGFSLAYQGGSHTNLVTGAPHSSLTGKVFKCPIQVSNKTINCEEAVIDVDKLAPYSRDTEPDLKLNLGYSVSAKEEYFFTCAPLWTMRIKTSKHSNVYANDSVGTCFVYNDTAHRYSGFAESLGDVKAPERIRGGNGWRTLLDDDNELLLIAKVAGDAELTHVNSSDPLQHVVSIMHSDNKEPSRQRNKNYLKSYRDLGLSLAAGKFFTNDHTTYYAISSLNVNTNKGTIHFMNSKISKVEGGIKKLFMVKKSSTYITIEDDGVGTMFGTVMTSANLNLDQLSELLVGAPAQENKDEGVYEAGAVHIYLGGDMANINTEMRHRIIYGNKELSRFGTAIAANDIDGDYLSELFVSAPYEDSEKGALYIISGIEIYKKLMNNVGFAKISMSDLVMTQRIQSDAFKTFGYSLQVVPDLDGNKCDDLAVGSPASQKIMLLRCLPSLNVTVEANHIGNQTTVHDKSFTILVCVTVQDLKNRSLPLALTISNEVKGEGAYIEAEQTKMSMNTIGTSAGENKCEEVVVKLFDNEMGTYFFYTRVELDENRITNSDDFDSKWAILSPYSKLSEDEKVVRQCKGSDCEPKLSMDLSWSGGIIQKVGEGTLYKVGSSDLLTATLKVTNTGNSSFESCALVRVSGATVAQLGCTEDQGQYKCYMPIPLKRNAEHSINIKLNMTQPTNKEEEILIYVVLRDLCNKPDKFASKVYYMKKIFNSEDIVLTGFSQKDRQISDTEIQDNRFLTTSDVHEYWVENNGNVTWMNISAEVTISMKPFISEYRVSSALSQCIKEDFPEKMMFLCTFTLAPQSKAKIISSVDIEKSKIVQNLKKNKLSVESKLILSDLYPSFKENKEYSLSTIITFKEELSFAQNKSLIVFLAILGAVIVLSAIMFVLYKMKFFQRTKLEEMKQEHVRRMSVKRSMSLSNEADGGLDMEVEDDDNIFEIVDMEAPVLPDDQK